jgi:hypothetical protein
MKKIITSLLTIFAMNSYAQPQRMNMPIVCDSAGDVLSYLTEKYGETPILSSKVYTGENISGTSIILVNKETQTWTNVIVNPDATVACVISSGKEYIMN